MGTLVTNNVTPAIEEFIKDNSGVLYTAVNMTRKVVGVGTEFRRVEREDGRVELHLACPDVSREHKLTGDVAIVPEWVSGITKVGDHTMIVKQLRYAGAQKSDSIAVFKAPNENAKTIIK